MSCQSLETTNLQMLLPNPRNILKQPSPKPVNFKQNPKPLPEEFHLQRSKLSTKFQIPDAARGLDREPIRDFGDMHLGPFQFSGSHGAVCSCLILVLCGFAGCSAAHHRVCVCVPEMCAQRHILKPILEQSLKQPNQRGEAHTHTERHTRTHTHTTQTDNHDSTT